MDNPYNWILAYLIFGTCLNLAGDWEDVRDESGKALWWVLGIVGTGLLVVLVIGGIVIGTNNTCVEHEKGLTAVYRDSQVQYDAFWKKVKESAQITDKYASDFKEVFFGGMDARYEGKDPALAFIMESNPTLDSATYTKVQQICEAGRNDFARTQRTLVDRQRAYDTYLSTFPNSAVVGMLGFPKPVTGEDAPPNDRDGDGMTTVLDYHIITSAKTQDVFETGREDEALDIFGDGASEAPQTAPEPREGAGDTSTLEDKADRYRDLQAELDKLAADSPEAALLITEMDVLALHVHQEAAGIPAGDLPSGVLDVLSGRGR